MKIFISILTSLFLFSSITYASDNLPNKPSVALTGINIGSNTLIEKLGNNINVHFVHFNALQLKVNQEDYSCFGTRGAGIRCELGVYNEHMNKPESLKNKIEFVDIKIGEDYIFDKLSSFFNTKFIHIDELILKINGKNYTCGGAGGQIRCHPIMQSN